MAVGLDHAGQLYDCQHCRANGLQKVRGCPAVGGFDMPEPVFYDGQLVTHCLAGEVTDQSISWLNDYAYLQINILPEPGGLNDQWEKDLQAFAIISQEKQDLEEAGPKDGRK